MTNASVKFWKPSTPRERDLSDLMARIKKEDGKAFPELLPKLHEFIPEYTILILSKLAPKLVSELKPAAGGLTDAQCAVLDLFCVFIYAYDKDVPETNPFQLMYNEANIIKYLFGHAGALDLRLINIIVSMFEYEPMIIVKWIKKNHKALLPLIKMAADTGNLESSKLVQRLAVSNMQEVYPLLVPFIKPLLASYPVSVVIDFMISSKEMKEVIPESKFEEWLLMHPQFTASDIEVVTKFYNFVWMNETSSVLLLRVTPPERFKDLAWMHRCQAQTYELSEESLEQCQNKLLINKYSDDEARDNDSKRTTMYFVYLFVLSLANPNKISDEVMHLLINFIYDESENENIAAAAVQCFIYWVSKYSFRISPNLVFIVCSTIHSEKVSEQYRSLCRAALIAFSKVLPMAGSIIMEDPAVRFSKEQEIPLKRVIWTFPHIVKLIHGFLSQDVYDINQAFNVLGYMDKFLFE